ncbi:hypothetical protein CTI12_AA558710 [Artemisia annua]|uniref:Uncharacterized protein n=1 Tax=Artemisia annua TaxID=35608 RepID=A0A2U1KVR1_ARTAN|nr:hypothetical protein CTI12_AA558710 [Artemisia annua]
MNTTRKSSLKDKIKQYLCFTCCFTTSTNDQETLNSNPSTYDNNNVSNNKNRPLYLIGASSQWIKSKASVDIPVMKHKCRNVFNKIGAKHNHRRRRSSTDFRYDPLSYALNFEEESCGNFEDDSPLKGFTSRLPSSPPPSSSSPKTALW